MTQKIFKFILFLSTWLLIAAACPGHADEVSLTPDNRLTIHAQDTYLQKILQEIAEQGVRVRIDPEINFRVTAAYDRKPIREVMDAILGNTNHALIWSDCPDCPDDGPDGGYRLTGYNETFSRQVSEAEKIMQQDKDLLRELSNRFWHT